MTTHASKQTQSTALHQRAFGTGNGSRALTRHRVRDVCRGYLRVIGGHGNCRAANGRVRRARRVQLRAGMARGVVADTAVHDVKPARRRLQRSQQQPAAKQRCAVVRDHHSRQRDEPTGANADAAAAARSSRCSVVDDSDVGQCYGCVEVVRKVLGRPEAGTHVDDAGLRVRGRYDCNAGAKTCRQHARRVTCQSGYNTRTRNRRNAVLCLFLRKNAKIVSNAQLSVCGLDVFVEACVCVFVCVCVCVSGRA